MDKSESTERGLTLIELMVSLAVATILGLAILGVITYGAARDRASSNATDLNDNARAALTLLTRDVASAGFMFGAAQSQCAITLSYDGGFPSGYVPMNPIWTVPQAAGQTLPMGGSPIPSTSGAIENYPASTNTNAAGVAQVLLISSAPSVSTYIAQTSAPIYIVQFGTTQSSSGGGAISSTQLPVSTLQLNSTTGISQGDTAFLQVPMNGGNVCMRIPIVNIGTATGGGATYIDSKPSSYMPPNGYSDFASQIPSSYGTLTNSNLLHSRILDLGQTADTLEIIQYWIDDSQGFPVLWRATYSALTDAMIQSEALAPGVVSLQVLFDTVPKGSPTGTPLTWKSWPDVASTDQIVTADVAIVARSLHSDPAYTAPATIVVPQPASGLVSPDAFVNYVPQTNEVHDHFSVYTAQLALRNLTWN
ncbi:MAG: PilW family protein [Acidiferrobacterales bacterium]